MQRKYELSISADYVPEWGVTEAVREFFQNAIDEQQRDSGNKMFFDYSTDEQCIRIGNRHSDLNIKTLLFGESTKRGNSEMIGSHGEGYKIATVVLLRSGKQVVFQNYCRREIWKPRLVKSRRYGGAMVPTFFVETEAAWKKVPENSLIIEIGGVTPEEYEDIRKCNLHLQEGVSRRETSAGAILEGEEFKGKIFVGGLYICTEQRLDMGVDIKPGLVHLERDRNLVSSFDVQLLVSNMITELKDAELTKNTLGTFAGQYISHYAVGMSVRDEIAEEFMEQYGEKAVPVSNQEESEEIRKIGWKPVIVPSTKKNIIENSEAFRVKKQEIETERKAAHPLDRLQAFASRVENRLSQEQNDELSEIIEQIKELLN